MLDGSGCRQISRRTTDFAERCRQIISGGAYRIRTDDLFHAMEARYQLRQCPELASL